jgi:hypothetical protein
VDSNLVAQHLAQAIRFQTVSYGDGVKEDEKTKALEAMHAWMETTYPYFHEAAGPEKFGESLLFTWIGKNPNLPPVMLMAHLDVVPVVPGYREGLDALRRSPATSPTASSGAAARSTTRASSSPSSRRPTARDGRLPAGADDHVRARPGRRVGGNNGTRRSPRRSPRAARISPGCWMKAARS